MKTFGIAAVVAAFALAACGAGDDAKTGARGGGAGAPAVNARGRGRVETALVRSGAQPKTITSLACLRKVALDLTDRSPAPQDMNDLASGAKSLAQIADAYLASPAFSQIALNWFRSAFAPTSLVPASADAEAPARLARYIVVNDRDFRELVTASYVVGQDGATTELGPDAAGVLTTQSYLSAATGIENRNWAGRLLRGMAGIALTATSTIPPGTDASREGLAANPACSGCHTHPVYGVDHAAAFRDCWDKAGLPIAGCAQNRELSFLGATGKTVPDLGRILTASVEWRAKMIQTFFTRLLGRQVGKNELPAYRAAESAWVAAGYKPKALIRHIVTSSEYCVR